MKIKVAVSAKGIDLDAQIDPRFGRCAYFIIVDADDMSFEAIDNESMALGGGAGIQAAQLVASKGAKVVITGSIGPNAFGTLSAAGIFQVFRAQTGTVRDAISDYKMGKLSEEDYLNLREKYRTRAIGSLKKMDELKREKDVPKDMEGEMGNEIEKEVLALRRGGRKVTSKRGEALFCTQCGGKRAPGDRFCSWCGTKLSTA